MYFFKTDIYNIHLLITTLQAPEIDPPSNITPNNATFVGNFTDLNPGSNISR